jgi:hypothetical protein
MYYKDTQNELHWVDSEEYEYMLPNGSVRITDEDAEILRQSKTVVDPNEQTKLQIAVLESSLTPRRIRESLLSGDQSFIKSVDDQIAVLRAQLG